MGSCTLIDTLRGPKILDMSIFDWIASMFGAWIVGKAIHVRYWILWLVGWIVFGVFVHWSMGIPTMFGYYLGLNEKPVRKTCT